MKSIKLIAVLFFALTIPNFAQQSNCPCEKVISRIPSDESKLIGKAYKNNNVGKNEQFFNNWVRSDIYLTNNTIVKNKYTRYNGLLDEILWMREPDFQIAVLDRKNISRVVLYTGENIPLATFERVNYKNIQHPENDDMFLQLLVDGNIKLYKKMEVVENNSTGELMRKDIYFLFKDNTYQSFQPRRLFLYRAFGADKKAIQKLVRSNHLIIKNESNLVNAINLYNQSVNSH